MIFADIIVDISHEDLDRSFQYIIPKELEEKIYVGVLVKIPFGRGNRIISGYVVGITKKPAWEISKMKKILEIEEQKVPVETELIALAGFIRENYGATTVSYTHLLTIPRFKASTSGSDKSAFATPPLYFNARTVATSTAASGFNPAFLHLISKNFSAPKSAPNPASVTT